MIPSLRCFLVGVYSNKLCLCRCRAPSWEQNSIHQNHSESSLSKLQAASILAQLKFTVWLGS